LSTRSDLPPRLIAPASADFGRVDKRRGAIRFNQVPTPTDWKKSDDCTIEPALQDEEVLKEKFPKGYKVVKPYLRIFPIRASKGAAPIKSQRKSGSPHGDFRDARAGWQAIHLSSNSPSCSNCGFDGIFSRDK
jgi:hypothetical protein